MICAGPIKVFLIAQLEEAPPSSANKKTAKTYKQEQTKDVADLGQALRAQLEEARAAQAAPAAASAQRLEAYIYIYIYALYIYTYCV